MNVYYHFRKLENVLDHFSVNDCGVLFGILLNCSPRVSKTY